MRAPADRRAPDVDILTLMRIASSMSRRFGRCRAAARRSIAASAVLVASTLLVACAAPPPVPELGDIYDEAAQAIAEERVPVVVIPGILGSRLEDADTGQIVWGGFVRGAADADVPEGARAVSLPMRMGTPLHRLRDRVEAVEVLDVVEVDLLLLARLRLAAYRDILLTLNAGKYRDRSLGESGAIDYGGLHYTCFQLAYDWRRDVSEQAGVLDRQIRVAQQASRRALGLAESEPVRVDVIAHSMGGLVLRYYLRYGATPLPEDGSIPRVTWAGAEHVRRAVLVGTPNSGSVQALLRLVDGLSLSPIAPNYRPAVLGTYPAIYQLLPRTRHRRVVDGVTGEAIDIFDPGVWARHGWGLASPDADRVLAWLLPEEATAEARRAVALDHLRKSLARAEAFHRALDREAPPPPSHLELHLFAGDSEATPDVLAVGADGSIEIDRYSPGDEVVPRGSALKDERVGVGYAPGLRSPVPWARVQFLEGDHLGITRTRDFVDNLLWLLLEKP